MMTFKFYRSRKYFSFQLKIFTILHEVHNQIKTLDSQSNKDKNHEVGKIPVPGLGPGRAIDLSFIHMKVVI